jgi:hypothetical protein
MSTPRLEDLIDGTKMTVQFDPYSFLYTHWRILTEQNRFRRLRGPSTAVIYVALLWLCASRFPRLALPM